jgi:hypothetical protein
MGEILFNQATEIEHFSRKNINLNKSILEF